MLLHAAVPASALLSLRQDTPSISVPGDFQSFFYLYLEPGGLYFAIFLSFFHVETVADME